jgi:heme A synthase
MTGKLRGCRLLEEGAMKEIYLGVVLLIVAQAVIGGWAFMEMLKPENVMQILRAFSMC